MCWEFGTSTMPVEVARGKSAVRHSWRRWSAGHDTDARGVVVEVTAEHSEPPVHGQSIITTIDLPIQIETERIVDELMDRWKPKGHAPS